MPVDPQIQALLDRGTGVPATHTLPVAEARRQYEARIALMAQPPEVAKVAERNIDGRADCSGCDLHACRQGPFPLMVSSMAVASCCAASTPTTACAVTSRQASAAWWCRSIPTCAGAQFPKGPDDCFAATHWAARTQPNSAPIRRRIMLSGDSAGGNMAAVTALRIRDEGGPSLCGQMLLYPVTETHTPGTRSYEENAEGFGLTRDTMKWFGDGLPQRCSRMPGTHTRRRCARKTSPVCRPPTCSSAEYDPLRDEGELYGERLQAAGVPVRITRRAGMNHGFLFWFGRVTGADTAMSDACAWGRRIFQRAS